MPEQNTWKAWHIDASEDYWDTSPPDPHAGESDIL
jgi:hypothetical protein